MKIRLSTEKDILDILEWRNDPLTRKMFVQQNKILFVEHSKWFKKNLLDPKISMYIGELNLQKVGICIFSFNSKKNSYEISINLNPKFRGKGLSFDLLNKSIKVNNIDKNYNLEAKIKKENPPSLRIFQKCNFKIISNDENFYYLRNF